MRECIRHFGNETLDDSIGLEGGVEEDKYSGVALIG